MKVLIADDSKSIRKMLQDILEQVGYEVIVTEDGQQAWNILHNEDLHLAILDLIMPCMDGFELLKRIRNTYQTKDLPVIILTSLSEINLKSRALDMGATDLLNKPFFKEDLLARIRSTFRVKRYQDRIKAQNELLEQKVKLRTIELEQSRMDIIRRLGRVAEFRDETTGNHIFRVGFFCLAIAEMLGMEKSFVDTLFLSSPLHDIGKIGISDNILLKRGKLSPEEYDIMKEHCAIGAEILMQDSKWRSNFLIKRNLHSSLSKHKNDKNPFIEQASTIALTHHEKWNGTGYPYGLKGDEIPLESRIVALSDVFDALCSDRPYKPAYSERKARSIIKDDVGKHFDPLIYDAFEKSIDEIRSIQIKFPDKSTNGI